ncbi:cytidylate kinase [Lishizhenia tianjinensis]|uniref:Cytidylate kinase n=1 Tax=Lishizhenia tianjinensis TaxID=477690 RepID=A0A1I7A600_9FLAO|nr:(d)CMP kinase [Lishizhenia tianjinensis]SFT70361.1 cytidylate kinase [Lishizhenia tianjinensis]
MKKLTIAIDGYSSCGKSTLAKALAKELNYIFVDTGAMYRGVSLYAIENELILDGQIAENVLISRLPEIDLSFEFNEKEQRPELLLNGKNVEHKIRTLEVSQVVSQVAKISEVRSFLVDKQRKMGETGGVVMDGRDIGSVVFPNAELKLFVTAAPEIRADRRFKELQAKGEDVNLEDVAANLKERDELDTSRKESPLIQTDDAIVLDNSNLTPDGQLELVLKWVGRIQNGHVVYE